MNASTVVFAVALNVGLAAINLIQAIRHTRRIKELSNGHRQSRASLRSGTGALQAPPPGERPGGNEAGAGADPEPVAQEIIAQRGWQLAQEADGRPILYSMSRPVPWDGPTLVADESPTAESPHGIYAQRELEYGYKAWIWGEVALSGRVVEGENGYRAECATIRSLVLRMLPDHQPTFWLGGFLGEQSVSWPIAWKKLAWQVADDLADRYQCEVTIDWVPTSNLPADELTV